MPWETDPPRERSETDPIRPVESMPEPARPGEASGEGVAPHSIRSTSSGREGESPRRAPHASPRQGRREDPLPPPPPGRLSSFASNEELFSAGAGVSDGDEVTDAFDRDGPSGGSADAGPGPAVRMTAAPGVAEPARLRPDAGSTRADPALDALRMRLDRQRRANQRLLWIMGGLLLVTFLLLLLWARESAPTDGDRETLPPAGPAAGADPDAADRPSESSAEERADAPPDASPDAPPNAPPDASPKPSPDVARPTIGESELQAVREAFERASDEARPLPDRIADAERAQRDLRELLDGVDRDELDEEIPALERAIARLLDRLRLRDFFP